jgi:CRISPR system Cascade subunit CasA
MDKEFNLLREGWIRVLDSGGAPRQLSLLETLARARNIARLAGELPTQDAALLRLLLAILYAVYAPTIADLRNDNQAVAFWRSLWEGNGVDLALVEAYLLKYEERFWLFHPQTPFYQCAIMKKRNGDGPNIIAPIITDVPSREERRFFTNRSGGDVLSLSFAEAARWLVNLQAWDYAGKKAAVVDGAENGGGTGWLGKLGVVYASCNTLYETLVLNFILWQSDGSPLPLGKPIWEKPPQTPRKIDDRAPLGYVELLTWQSRRTQIFKTGDRVTGMLASYGDVFEKENTFLEQMSGWHLSSEKGNTNKYIPNTHRAGRHMWRDLSSLLPRSDNPKNKPPAIVPWVELLYSHDVTGIEYVNLSAVGAEFGAMQGVITELVSDSVTINAAILVSVGKDWVTRICDALEKTEKCIEALGRFASELETAVGNSDNPKTNNRSSDKSSVATAAAQAYFDLDLPFRGWLGGIDPDRDDEDDKVSEWLRTVERILSAQAREILKNAGSSALTGKNSAIPKHSKFRKFLSSETR